MTLDIIQFIVSCNCFFFRYTKEKHKIKKVIYVRKDLLDVSASITAKSYPSVPTTTVERPLSLQYDSSFQ